MPLMAWAITVACQNFTTWQNHQDACNSFFTQGTQKIGIYQEEQKVEDYSTLQAKEAATNNLGVGAVDTVGVLGYTYRVYRNKSIAFKLPTMGLCDSLSNTITTNSYTINIKWNIPWSK